MRLLESVATVSLFMWELKFVDLREIFKLASLTMTSSNTIASTASLKMCIAFHLKSHHSCQLLIILEVLADVLFEVFGVEVRFTGINLSAATTSTLSGIYIEDRILQECPLVSAKVFGGSICRFVYTSRTRGCSICRICVLLKVKHMPIYLTKRITIHILRSAIYLKINPSLGSGACLYYMDEGG